MNKLRIRYFEQEDVIHLAITDKLGSRSLELSPGITVELNDKDEMIGIEILNGSNFLRDAVLESIQAKRATKRNHSDYQRAVANKERT